MRAVTSVREGGGYEPEAVRAGARPARRRGLTLAEAVTGLGPCTSWHQRRLSSPPASVLPERKASARTVASSAPFHAGVCAAHQRTSRISRHGSASGSQSGQYGRATAGVSGKKSVTGR